MTNAVTYLLSLQLLDGAVFLRQHGFLVLLTCRLLSGHGSKFCQLCYTCNSRVKNTSCCWEIADRTYLITVSSGSLLLMSFLCDASLPYDHHRLIISKSNQYVNR